LKIKLASKKRGGGIMLNDPDGIERMVWMIFGVGLVVMAIIGRMDNCSSRKNRQTDRTRFILSVSGLVIMVVWIILANITPLIWWKYYLRYCYLGVFPIITLSIYLMETIAAWYRWDYAVVVFIVVLFIAISLWGCLIYPCLILAYIYEVGEKFITAVNKWRQNPVA